MKKEIICENCQFENPLGSKFCSNCGFKLPLSTHILCSNCSTPNLIDRIFCDNCGTRLVQDDPLSEDEEVAEEPPKSGRSAFSLPARQPGDTGELHPNLVPDWLIKGEQRAEEQAEDDQGQPEEDEPQQEKIGTEELSKIDELTPDKSLTDELPDWLMDQIDSDPIIPEPAGITTELYLDLVKDSEVPALDLDELSLDEESTSADDAAIDDWLSDAQEPDLEKMLEGEEETGTDADGLPGLTELLDEANGDLEDKGKGLTDWLTESDTHQSVTPVDKEADESVSDLNGWLSEDEPNDQLDALEIGEGSGLTDWLSEPDETMVDGALSGESDAGQSEASGDEAGLTNWLTNLDELEMASEPEEDWFSEIQGGEEEAGVKDWLEGLNQLTDSQPDIESKEPEGLEEEEDWFTSLADEAALSDDESSTADQESLSVTAWLSDSAPLDPAALEGEEAQPDDAEMEVAEALDALFDDSPPEAPAQSEIIEPKDAVQSEPEMTFEGEIEQPVGNQEDVLLDAFSGETSDEEGSLEGFDWLEDIEDIEKGVLDVPDEPEEVPELSDEDEPAPGVFAETAVAPSTDPSPEALEAEESPDDFLGEDELGEGLPEWMNELGTPLSSQATDSEPSDRTIDREIEEDLPEWLTKMRPDEEGLIGSSLPSALTTDDKEISLSDVGMDLSEADLPDWLMSGAGELPTAFLEGPSDIPDWLADADNLKDKRGSKEDWDSTLLDKLPPAKKEPELEKVKIPDWLLKFKPQELDEEEAQLSTISGLAEPDTEAPEGKPVGISGIIKIEPAILPQTPLQAPSMLTISPNQTSQIELLRQLQKERRPSFFTDDREPALDMPNLWNMVVALALFFVVALSWLAPGLIPIRSTPLVAEAEAFVDILQSVSNQPILVALEFTPAMAGELNLSTQTILEQLAANNNTIIPVTQHPTAVGLFPSHSQLDINGMIVLPGNAIGLRLLTDCLNQEALSCSAIPTLSQIEQSDDIGLIVLITSERDTVVNWVEQVSLSTDIPIIIHTTQAVEPVSMPYIASNQIEGVITQASLMASHISNDQAQQRLERQSVSSHWAQLAALSVLIISLIGTGFTSFSPNIQGSDPS